MSRQAAPLLLCAVVTLGACAHAPRPIAGGSGGHIDPTVPAPGPRRALRVTATAYNSLPGQGSGDPTLAAWGDRLRPGMRAIAVSRDLLELGLTRGARVTIEGLPGEYVVLDKMASRWTRRIDVYMGTDRRSALRWGVRDVSITWSPATVPANAAE